MLPVIPALSSQLVRIALPPFIDTVELQPDNFLVIIRTAGTSLIDLSFSGD